MAVVKPYLQANEFTSTNCVVHDTFATVASSVAPIEGRTLETAVSKVHAGFNQLVYSITAVSYDDIEDFFVAVGRSDAPPEPPTDIHYDHSGAVVIAGITSVHKAGRHYSEAGGLVIDGTAEVRYEHPIHRYSEAGAIVIAGFTDAIPWISNATNVAQTVAEFLITGTPSLAVSQVIAEFLYTTTPPIRVSQAVAEFMIADMNPTGSVAQVVAEFLVTATSAGIMVPQVVAEFLTTGPGAINVGQVVLEFMVIGWKGRGDFMPMLARLVGRNAEG